MRTSSETCGWGPSKRSCKCSHGWWIPRQSFKGLLLHTGEAEEQGKSRTASCLLFSHMLKATRSLASLPDTHLGGCNPRRVPLRQHICHTSSRASAARGPSPPPRTTLLSSSPQPARYDTCTATALQPIPPPPQHGWASSPASQHPHRSLASSPCTSQWLLRQPTERRRAQ